MGGVFDFCFVVVLVVLLGFFGGRGVVCVVSFVCLFVCVVFVCVCFVCFCLFVFGVVFLEGGGGFFGGVFLGGGLVAKTCTFLLFDDSNYV